MSLVDEIAEAFALSNSEPPHRALPKSRNSMIIFSERAARDATASLDLRQHYIGETQPARGQSQSSRALALTQSKSAHSRRLLLAGAQAERHFTEFGQLSATLNLLTCHPLPRSLSVLSYQLAAHGGLMVPAPAQNFPMVRRSKWHTKGSTKHFDS